MFSISSFVRTVQAWFRRPGGLKPSKRASPALECLDHRQLLSVNFTGNAVIDIPATNAPGTVIILDDGTARPANLPADLAPIIKVSGLDISGIRLNYTPNDDILSIALQSPDNQKTGQPVLAGDTDNNGDGGTVDPAVLMLRPDFKDFAYLGESESMAAFLDLTNDGIPDVIAGIARGDNGAKLYQVADAVVNPDPTIASTTRPEAFGTPLLTNTGAAFLSNSPAAPNFEFQITNFSELYQAKVGSPLADNSVFKIGAYGGSRDDDGINESFFPLRTLSLGNSPPPPPVCPPAEPCPPLEPPILINPHENRHINTAHPTDVRVNILGTARFDVDSIDAASVRLGGAAPIASFDRRINNDRYKDRTLVFRGSDIKLPRGVIDATVTGNLTDGQTFSSTYQVFNRNFSYYSPGQIAAQQARQQARGFSAENPPLTPFQQGKVGQLHDLALEQEHGADAAGFESPARATVAIPRRKATASAAKHGHSMASMTTEVAGVAAGTRTGSINPDDSPLTVSIPLRPVTQEVPPTTVRIARKPSAEIHDTTVTGHARGRAGAGFLGRAGMARAAQKAGGRG